MLLSIPAIRNARTDISSEPFFIYNSSNSATHWTQIKIYDLLEPVCPR